MVLLLVESMMLSSIVAHVGLSFMPGRSKLSNDAARSPLKVSAACCLDGTERSTAPLRTSLCDVLKEWWMTVRLEQRTYKMWLVPLPVCRVNTMRALPFFLHESDTRNMGV